MIDYLTVEEVGDEDLLRLTLNTLYALSEKKDLPVSQIKASFELRAASVSGFEPDLNCCAVCGKAEFPKGAVLDVMNGRLLCPECANDPANELENEQTRTANVRLKLSASSLEAARFTAYAPLEKYLSYTLDRSEMPLFGACCERYLLSHIEHGFKSLDYYNDLIRYGYSNE